MITMPVQCKIVTSFSAKISVTLLSSGVDKPVEDTFSIFPNSLSKIIDVTWVNLTKKELQEVETALVNSKASKRFSWNGYAFLIEEGYSIDVIANKPTITASFRRVA